MYNVCRYVYCIKIKKNIFYKKVLSNKYVCMYKCICVICTYVYVLLYKFELLSQNSTKNISTYREIRVSEIRIIEKIHHTHRTL